MFDEFGVYGLHNSRHEFAEGYLSVKDRRELLFQLFYCRLMVESVELRLVWGLGWWGRRRSRPIDSYIHDASQRGCI